MKMSYKLTKADLRKVSYRAVLGSQLNWNYERMMSSGYLFAILPALKKIYHSEPEQLQDMLRTQNQFFNTHGFFMPLILGLDLAIEEADGHKAKDTVIALKTALMGTLAGVGDSIFHVIWGTIFGSIAATFALQGSLIGCIIFAVANLLLVFFGQVPLIFLGYRQGTSLVTTVKDKFNYVTEAATVLGMIVVGALIPTIVKVQIPFIYQNGEVKLEIQTVLDSIMPALLPILLVGFAYWLLGRKRMNSTRVILFMLVFSILFSALGLLA